LLVDWLVDWFVGIGVVVVYCCDLLFGVVVG
jgi:hypothetical protein